MMSGGSWDYFCFRCDDVAEKLCNDASPLRRAFGEHMKLIAHAMHEIEWVDSGDKSRPDDINAIREAMTSWKEKELSILIDDAKKVAKRITELTEEE